MTTVAVKTVPPVDPLAGLKIRTVTFFQDMKEVGTGEKPACVISLAYVTSAGKLSNDPDRSFVNIVLVKRDYKRVMDQLRRMTKTDVTDMSVFVDKFEQAIINAIYICGKLPADLVEPSGVTDATPAEP